MTSFDPRDPVVQRLLDAGRDDLPSEHVVERAIVAVSVAAAGVSVTASAAASQAAGAGVSAAAKNIGASLGWLAFAKWTGVGLGAGLVTLTALDGVSRLTAREPSPVVIVAPKREATPVAVAPRAMRPPAELVAPKPDELNEPTTTGATHPQIDPLGREVSRLDSARSALDRGEPSSALASLSRYETEYPQGRLLPEALVLRMRALEQLGDRAGAQAAARRIIEISPSSPHAVRAKALLDAR